MISNQILQNTIDGLKTITRIELSVMDSEGKVLATTEEGGKIDEYNFAVPDFVNSQAESQLVQGYQFFLKYMMITQ